MCRNPADDEAHHDWLEEKPSDSEWAEEHGYEPDPPDPRETRR